MSLIATSHVPVDDLPEVAPAEKLSRWAIPWLLSTSAHVVVILLLAMTVHVGRGIGSRSDASINMGLDSVMSVSLNSDASGDGSGASFSTNPYYNDEQESPAITAPESSGGGGGAPRLADLLAEKPPVDLKGVLPAAHAALGAGTLGEGGVGNAGAMRTQPAAGRGVRGGYVRTGVFGAVGEGSKFVYVFDRSGSMDAHGGVPLAAAKAQLIASLNDLGQVQQFQIIFYNEHPKVFNVTGTPGKLVFGTDHNKHLATQFVNGIRADGATQHEEAIKMALRMGADVIFFLTDADEPRLSSQQLAQIARLNKGTAINAIEFGYGVQGDPYNFLVQLARGNGGQHVYVDISRLNRVR